MRSSSQLTASVAGSMLVTVAVVRVAAQAPNVPVFSLWATEVSNGIGGPNRCTSCPTQNIPLGEVLPGDMVRVEIFVSGWDAQPGMGKCNGDPGLGQDGPCTNIGSAAECPGSHCTDTGTFGLCSNISGCGGSAVCVQNTCQPYPRLTRYQVKLDASSLAPHGCGELTPYRSPCDPLDCAILADGVCPCAQYYVNSNQCTCADPIFASCDASINLCGIGASAFIEAARPDYLFFTSGFFTPDDLATETVSLEDNGDVVFSAVLHEPYRFAVGDKGTRRLLGAMLLKLSPDASGFFEIAFVKDGNVTYVAGYDFAMPDRAVYQDLVINIPGDCGFFDSDHDGVFDLVDNCHFVSNPDQADCDGNGVGDVCDQVCGGEIEWTTFPADGAIDARVDVDAVTGLPVGITQFDVSFGCLVGIGPSGSPPGAVDFEVADTSGEAQVVIAAASSDDCLLGYVLITAEPLRSGEWTTIATTVDELHTNGMPAVSETLLADVGFLPGDVDGSGSVDPFDVEALQAALELFAALTLALELSVDIDRSGALTAFDLVREVDLLNGANSTRAWNGQVLPVKPN